MRVCIHVYVCMCADMIYVYICMCVCICTSRCNDNQQITVSHFGEHKRLHLDSSKQNFYIISLRAIIKAIFTPLSHNLFFVSPKKPPAHQEEQKQFPSIQTTLNEERNTSTHTASEDILKSDHVCIELCKSQEWSNRILAVHVRVDCHNSSIGR